MSFYLCPYCYDSVSEHSNKKLKSCLKESYSSFNEIIVEIKSRSGNCFE